MRQPIVFMYSGQGSQYFQMGKELFECHPRFQRWMQYCNTLVEPKIGVSLLDIIYHHNNQSQPFDRVLYSNPAILAIEYSLSRVLNEIGIKPDYVLGYSLGEFTAAVMSDAISLSSAFDIVIGFAEMLEKNSPEAEMLAIVSPLKEVQQSFRESFSSCWVTGMNMDNHFVLSGLPQNIQNIHQQCKDANIISQLLPVKYGFHTPLMDDLEYIFKERTSIQSFYPLNVPMFSCLHTQIIEDVDENYFWDVIRQPVKFQQAIQQFIQQQSAIFLDVGPSGTLSTFVKYILSATEEKSSLSSTIEIMNPFGRDLDTLERMKNSLNAR